MREVPGRLDVRHYVGDVVVEDVNGLRDGDFACLGAAKHVDGWWRHGMSRLADGGLVLQEARASKSQDEQKGRDCRRGVENEEYLGSHRE